MTWLEDPQLEDVMRDYHTMKESGVVKVTSFVAVRHVSRVCGLSHLERFLTTYGDTAYVALRQCCESSARPIDELLLHRLRNDF